MHPRTVRNLAVSMMATAILTACGGGGMDSGGITTPPPGSQGTYNLQAAMTAAIHSGLGANVNLSGTVLVNGTPTPFSGTGTFSLTAATSGTFNHMSALLQTERISGTVAGGGQSTAYNSSVVNAYDTGATSFLGESQDAEFDVAQSPILFPMSVGTTATPLGTVSRYSDTTLSVVLGTTDVSVSVTLIPVDAGSNEIVQFTYKTYDQNHTLIQTDTLAFSLSPSNVLAFHTAQTQNASGTITASAQ